MKRKYIKAHIIVCTTAALIALTACGGKEPDPAKNSEDVKAEDVKTEDHAASGEASLEDDYADKEPAGASKTDISESAGLPQPYARYMEVLEQIKTEGRDPNGREYYSDESWNFENNSFAILDVDNDGRQELIFNFNESYMGNMCEVVYEYDAETDTLREELAEWVSTEYYYQGLVRVQMSHNHGKDPEGRGIWPYMIYQYDEEDDSYQLLYVVDAWDGQIYEEDFPDELDTDGDKLLYCITVENAGESAGTSEGELSNNEILILDQEEYDSWAEELWMSEWNRVNVVYHPVTEDFMEGIKSAYIQAAAYAAQADVWFMWEEAGPDNSSYLLYDLDGDGILELTASVMQGTGRYSYNYFYGLTGSGKVTELELVRLCDSKEREWDADFDIGGRTRIQAYRDGNGIIYYEGNDYVRNGIYGGYDESGFYYLKDGVVYQDSIRRRTDYFDDREGQQVEEIHYYSMKEDEEYHIPDEEITKEQYEAIREEYISDMTEIKVRQNWEYFLWDEIKNGDITEEIIRIRLFDSFFGSE